MVRARKGLIDKGIIRQVGKTDHELTGVDNDWEIDQTPWKRPGLQDATDSPGNPDAIIRETRTVTVPETRTESVLETRTGNPGRTPVEPKADALSVRPLFNPTNQPTNRPPAEGGGGLVDSSGSVGSVLTDADRDEAAIAEIVVKAAEEKRAKEIEEWESIPECATCGRDRWTDNLDQHRKSVSARRRPMFWSAWTAGGEGMP